ncbi:MAG: hypothetical protein M3Q07_20700 [Pseudobdellovibrionaceae bacterium]|nr:hypothetical protein [Pseudobdellovibrionaceae bacterium]
MPLKGTEDALADALFSAATATKGDAKVAWENVAKIIVGHITESAVVTGTTPNGGPVVDGKIT